MNFKIFKRLIALPLNTTEMAVTSALAFHVQQDGNSCFPSYETISKESGACNKTISKVKRTLVYAGILKCKHRASPLTGKESNEYFFIFEGVNFYQDRISKTQFKELDSKLKEIRKKVTTEMKTESLQKKANKKKAVLAKQSQMLRNTNSQNVNNDVCNVAGLEGHSIPSQMSPIPSQMLRRSNRDNVQLADINTQGSNANTLCNEKKKVSHGKEINPFDTVNQDSHFEILDKQKDPSKQTNAEWLADMENAEQKYK